MISPAHNLSTGILPEEFGYFFEKLAPFGRTKQYKKGEMVVTSGEICNKLFFVKQGILRTFRLNDQGDEITSGFTFPGDFDTIPDSFFSQSPSKENIISLTDSEIESYYFRNIGEIMASDPKISSLVFKVLSGYIETLEFRLFEMRQGNAEKRYLDLMKVQPDAISKVPLGQLASYLGISKERMSRIRKKIGLKQL